MSDGTGKIRRQKGANTARASAGEAALVRRSRMKKGVSGPLRRTSTSQHMMNGLELVPDMLALARQNLHEEVDVQTAVVGAWAMLLGRRQWTAEMVVAVNRAMRSGDGR